MNETKNYKNINVNELGMRSKIRYNASRIAFFVPRSLARLAKKLIVSPITKLVTGKSYEEVKEQATEYAVADQKLEAADLEQQVIEGRKNLEDWKNDKEYYIGTMAEYKSYEASINDLEKKQKKLLSSPRKLLIAKNYLVVMKENAAKRSESKKVSAVVKEYQERTERIRSLEEQIKEEQRALEVLKRDNPSIIAQFVAFLENNPNSITPQEATPVKPAPAVVPGPALKPEPSLQQPVRTQVSSANYDDLIAGLEQNGAFAHSYKQKPSMKPGFQISSSNNEDIMAKLEQNGAFARPYTPKPAPAVVPGTVVEPVQPIVKSAAETENILKPAPAVVPGTVVEPVQPVVKPAAETENILKPAPAVVPGTVVEPEIAESIQKIKELASQQALANLRMEEELRADAKELGSQQAIEVARIEDAAKALDKLNAAPLPISSNEEEYEFPAISADATVQELSSADNDLLAQMGEFAKQTIKVKPVQRAVSQAEYEQIMGRRR